MKNSNNYLFVKIFVFITILSVLFLLNTFVGSSNKKDMDKAKPLYIEHCSKCHRKDGRGIKRVYPPLKKADYIKKVNTIELLQGMIFGRSGKIIVNGVTYNGVMTTEVDNSLSDKDIALILTYIYREMNDMNINVKTSQVAEARKAGKLPPHKD